MSTKVKLLLVICSVFVAAIAVGSNMGFKLNYALATNTDGNNINWVALPYFNNYPDAIAACNDINTVDCPGTPNLASSISYFDTATNSYGLFICGGSKGNFNISGGVGGYTGRGYAISATANTCTWKLVGSHNDSFDTAPAGVSFAINTDGNNINWISVPYHSTAASANLLCTQINANCSNIATSASYFDTATNSYGLFICGGSKGNYNILPGRSIAVSVTAAGSSCWHPAHY
jgi:hypothetical protein